MTGLEPPGARDPNQPFFPPPPPQQPQQPYGAYGAMPPPTAPAYPTHQPHQPRRTEPLGGLGTAASVLLGVAAAASIGVAFPFFNRANLIDDFVNGGVSLTDIEDADNLVFGLLGLWALVVLATGIVFIIWQFRHSSNAEALRGPHGLGPGWAIGGWFIPLANLVLPFLELRQSAQASDPGLPPGAPYERGRAPGILTAWTATYIAAPVLLVSANALGAGAEDAFRTVGEALDKFAQADRLAGAAMLVYAAAAVLGLLMVRTLTQRQDQAVTGGGQPQVQQVQYPQQPPPPSGSWDTPPQAWGPPQPPQPQQPSPSGSWDTSPQVWGPPQPPQPPQSQQPPPSWAP